MDATSGLQALQNEMEVLASKSFQNEEMLLDAQFSAEEVSAAVAELKNLKAAEPDGLMAEHLKEGRESVVIWLMNVQKAVVELEVVPEVLKRGYGGTSVQERW